MLFFRTLMSAVEILQYVNAKHCRQSIVFPQIAKAMLTNVALYNIPDGKISHDVIDTILMCWINMDMRYGCWISAEWGLCQLISVLTMLYGTSILHCVVNWRVLPSVGSTHYNLFSKSKKKLKFTGCIKKVK